jgi:hypothetical protein
MTMECPAHGESHEYLICDHIRNGEPIDYFEEATNENTGFVLCSSCEVKTRKEEDKPEELQGESIVSICAPIHLFCSKCAYQIFVAAQFNEAAALLRSNAVN